MKSTFASWDIKDKLLFILENPEKVNPIIPGADRRTGYTRALMDAVDVLPDGKSKRALNYVANNPAAILNFGGADAVGPAIEEAIRIMTKKG